MINIFLVYESGNLATVNDVSLEQAGQMVQMYPALHLFYTENGAT